MKRPFTKYTLLHVIMYEAMWFLSDDINSEEGQKDLNDSTERIIFSYGKELLSEVFGVNKESIEGHIRSLLVISKANHTKKTK